MYCKDCKFRHQDDPDYHPYCLSEKITESNYDITFKPEGDRLIYSYIENGTFYVEDYFGCVHFEAKEAEEAKESESL